MREGNRIGFWIWQMQNLNEREATSCVQLFDLTLFYFWIRLTCFVDVLGSSGLTSKFKWKIRVWNEIKWKSGEDSESCHVIKYAASYQLDWYTANSSLVFWKRREKSSKGHRTSSLIQWFVTGQDGPILQQADNNFPLHQSKCEKWSNKKRLNLWIVEKKERRLSANEIPLLVLAKFD